MTALPQRSRIVLRIYGVSVALLVSVASGLSVLTLAAGGPHGRAEYGRHVGYAVRTVGAAVGDPAALNVQLDRVRVELNANVTLYDNHGGLVASTVRPPLPPLQPGDRAGLRRGEVFPASRWPDVAAGYDHGYGIVRGRPPTFPTGMTLWAAALALGSAAVAAWLLARTFARPLASLTAVARALGRGDLGARARLRQRDEFGELGAAFDEMADRVSGLVRARQALLANVSHELRTPLARIRVALDLAAEGDAETARESLGEIAEDLSDLERLVDDVLQTARLDLAAGRAGDGAPPLRLARVDTRGFLARTVHRFTAAHPDRVVTVAVDDGLPDIMADEGLLRRVLDNLLDNAWKYADGSQPITVRAATETDRVVLAVVDRGVGIEKADLPSVGTPFFRTDRSRARSTGGLGLGLSLARRIAEAHGGRMTVTSTVGVGTTVRVELPVGITGP